MSELHQVNGNKQRCSCMASNRPKICINPMDPLGPMLPFHFNRPTCDYNVREPKSAPECLYYQYFGGLLGFIHLNSWEAMVKEMVPHLSLYASCGFAVAVIPICYVFFFIGSFLRGFVNATQNGGRVITGRFQNGTQTARQFHGERGPHGPNHHPCGQLFSVVSCAGAISAAEKVSKWTTAVSLLSMCPGIPATCGWLEL